MTEQNPKETNEKISDSIVDTYRKIEDAVVGGYKRVEEAVVGTYQKIEDKFVENYLLKDGETLKEAKARLKSEAKK